MSGEHNHLATLAKLAYSHTGPGVRDPLSTLRAIAMLRWLLDRAAEQQVRKARQHGASWGKIAAALEVSRQSAHERYSGRRRASRSVVSDLDVPLPGA